MAGLPSITRRIFLKSTPVAVVAIGAVSAASATEAMSARERFDFHLEEMKKAALEVNPLVRFNRIVENLDETDSPMALLIMGSWATGRYQGDGLYDGTLKSAGIRKPYKVKILDTKIDGERSFSVVKVGERDRKQWMVLSEPAFESFIGAKIAST